jgi:hypothetical protein
VTTYTVQIEASDEREEIWQALAPAENTSADDSAAAVAAWVAGNQNVAEGDHWRVRVWYGADADVHTKPDAECTAVDLVLDELRGNRDRVAGLDKRRDELVRQLMAIEPTVPRAAIAEAARLSEPRLYQIRRALPVAEEAEPEPGGGLRPGGAVAGSADARAERFGAWSDEQEPDGCPSCGHFSPHSRAAGCGVEVRRGGATQRCGCTARID